MPLFRARIWYVQTYLRILYLMYAVTNCSLFLHLLLTSNFIKYVKITLFYTRFDV